MRKKNIIALLCLTLLVSIALILSANYLGLFDIFVNNYFSVRDDSAISFMKFISNILEPNLIAIYVLILVLLLATKIKKEAVFAFACGLVVIPLEIIKILVHRIRPDSILVSENMARSFPSGHSTMALILFSLLIYLFKDNIKDRFLRILFISLNVLLVLLVGFSRIYLGAHWFSDVISGYLLALIWFLLCVLVFVKPK